MDFLGSYKIIRASTVSHALLLHLKSIMGSPATQNSFRTCAQQYTSTDPSAAQEMLRRSILSPLPWEQQELVRETTKAFVTACTCCIHHYYTDYGKKLWTIHVNETHDGSYEVKFPTIGSIVRNEKVHIAGALIRNYPMVFLNHMQRLEPRKPRRCLNK
jgi:hypothetical protein